MEDDHAVRQMECLLALLLPLADLMAGSLDSYKEIGVGDIK